MSKSSSASNKETDYIPDIIRDDHNGIVYKKGAFFGKVRQRFSILSVMNAIHLKMSVMCLQF